jgi:hypothetical protein
MKMGDFDVCNKKNPMNITIKGKRLFISPAQLTQTLIRVLLMVPAGRYSRREG